MVFRSTKNFVFETSTSIKVTYLPQRLLKKFELTDNSFLEIKFLIVLKSVLTFNHFTLFHRTNFMINIIKL